jgi:tetratricopeptide (TPR) repeat protein
MRQRDLGPTFVEVNDFLISIYNYRISKFWPNFEKHPEEIKNYVEKILKIKQNDYAANLMMAYYYDLMGNQGKAIEFNDKAEACSPKNSHDHLFNRAYFYICSEKYDEAINIYKNIPQSTKSTTSTISNYLSDKYKKNGEPALLFADGYISYKWDDEKIGKRNLRRFKKEVLENSKYAPLLREVDELKIN